MVFLYPYFLAFPNTKSQDLFLYLSLYFSKTTFLNLKVFNFNQTELTVLDLNRIIMSQKDKMTIASLRRQVGQSCWFLGRKLGQAVLGFGLTILILPQCDTGCPSHPWTRVDCGIVDCGALIITNKYCICFFYGAKVEMESYRPPPSTGDNLYITRTAVKRDNSST